jgi:hypothetical protein
VAIWSPPIFDKDENGKDTFQRPPRVYHIYNAEDVKHKEGGDRHNQDEHGGSEESASRNRLGLTCLVVREHVSHFSLLSVGCFLLLAYMLIRVSATPATVLVGCPGLLLEMEAALSVWDTAGYLGV